MQGDDRLIQIVDAALAEAARKSGAWLVCRPGCADCCMGEFPITQLDAMRLRAGLAELQRREPERAARVHQRAREAAWKHPALAPELDHPEFDHDEPCAALDPETRTCDLYAARPITCRVFGPPVSCGSEAVGVCELCYHGASNDEIAACAVEADPDGIEATLLEELEERTGLREETTVALALAGVKT